MTSLRGSTEVTISARASARFSNAASRYSGAVDTLAERSGAELRSLRRAHSARRARFKIKSRSKESATRQPQTISVAGYLNVDREPPLTLRYSRFMVRHRVKHRRAHRVRIRP